MVDRYVDDIHLCANAHVDEFHSHPSSIIPHIKFTIEIRSLCCLFLNIKATRQEDGSITVSVYRKALTPTVTLISL